MIPLEELQLRLDDLRQALDFEKRHRYVDVMGRKKTFSQFVAESLRNLEKLPLFPKDEDLHHVHQLGQRFRQYKFMDVSGRMHALEAVETLIETLLAASTAPKHAPRSISREPVGGLENTSDGFGDPDRATRTTPHETDVQFVKGVGPKLSKLLNLVGINTVEDLLYYFPRRYLDYHNRVKIAALKEGDEVTVLGTVRSVSAFNPPHKNLAIVTVTVEDETGSLLASWFYGKSSKGALEQYKSRYAKGASVMLSGKIKYDRYKRKFAMDRPQLEILSYAHDSAAGASGEAGEINEPESLHAGRIVPVYPLTEGLNLRFLRRTIHQALETSAPDLIDPLPEALRKRYQLMDLVPALQKIHFPETMEDYQNAHRRLVFDELFYLQARLALLRADYKRTVKGLSLQKQPGHYSDKFLAQLPFQLTHAQQRVLSEIEQDLAGAEPMYRLLQGDVGSGKTVVALLTLLIAVENGYQGALMAPTEILAEQHYKKFVEWLTPLGLKAGLFVGKSGVKERREMRQGLLNGQIHIAVGTHALIQDDVEFLKLGIVVVDEQHRFGVRQRTLLKDKGDHPEMLTMTATPIPRTLAMTLHGDLDISILDELPPGRTPIRTSLLRTSQSKQAYQLIRQEVLQKRQVYIVFPLIEESETLAAKAATTEAEKLQTEIFPEFKIGLLHGKMRPEEKEAVMGAFSSGELDILVSTTVVEVGVDVPNATVMVIENADRFGLSQLHQLRGRVGRGRHASYCILLNDSRNPETVQRLKVMEETTDGFVIAEKDLAIRGPGEFLGTRQSGLPDFVLADLINDQAILNLAREAAFEIVNNPEYLSEHPYLKAMIFQKTENTFSVLGSG